MYYSGFVERATNNTSWVCRSIHQSSIWARSRSWDRSFHILMTRRTVCPCFASTLRTPPKVIKADVNWRSRPGRLQCLYFPIPSCYDANCMCEWFQVLHAYVSFFPFCALTMLLPISEAPRYPKISTLFCSCFKSLWLSRHANAYLQSAVTTSYNHRVSIYPLQ